MIGPKIKEQDHISFCMPAFNSASTITESVESIMNGNFNEGDEMIIVNDGSTDNTVQIVLALKKKYPAINLISYPDNRGCPAARNIAYAATKNPIIFNLYADDVLAPGSVPKLKSYMAAEEADMAGFVETRYFHVNKKEKKSFSHTWVSRSGLLTLADLLAGDINPGPGGNYMFKKVLWQEVGGVWEYGKGMHEAWGFTLKCLAADAKFVVMPDSFYYHRYGTDSLFMREAKKENEVSLMATKMITPYLDLLDPRDAAYIRSEEGSKNWYNAPDRAPIRLKNKPVGKTGCMVIPPKEKLKRITLRITRLCPPLYKHLFQKQ